MEDLTKKKEGRIMEKWHKDQKNEEEGSKTFEWRVSGSPCKYLK